MCQIPLFGMSDPEEVEPVQSGAEEEEEEKEESEGDDKEEKKKVHYPAVPETAYRERDVIVPFDKIEYDWQASLGQARPMSKTSLDQRLVEMRAALPTSFLKVTLWPSDMHGMLLEEARPQR